MTYCYSTDTAAVISGWRILTAFNETKNASPDQRYKAVAEYEMNGTYRIFLSAFLKILSLFSCGCASKHAQIRQWQTEVETGKVTSEIFCRAIGFSAPVIISDKWGEIQLKVDGVLKTFADVAINQGLAQEWNWRWSPNPMHHHPGIRKEEIDHFFLSHPVLPKPEVIILSRGRGDARKPGGVLEVMPDVESYIKAQGIEVHVLKTEDAISKYKQLQSLGKRIGALIHTTC